MSDAAESQLSECDIERVSKSIRVALKKSSGLDDPSSFQDKNVVESRLSVSSIIESSEIFISKLKGIDRINYYLSGVNFDHVDGEWILNYDCIPLGSVSGFDCGFRIIGSNDQDTLYKYELYP